MSEIGKRIKNLRKYPKKNLTSTPEEYYCFLRTARLAYMDQPRKAILCVDDEAIVLNSLKGQLQANFGNEFLLEFAESAEEAWEVIEDLNQSSVDLLVVVSDWLMPGMRGDEFLVRLHKKYPHIRTVMLTGQADPAAIERVRREAELFRLISKPWEEKELVETIRQGLG